MRQIVITLADSYVSRLQTVAEELRREGVSITRLYEFGVIIGAAEEETISRIRNRKEILSLTEEKQAHIPPPDAEIQ